MELDIDNTEDKQPVKRIRLDETLDTINEINTNITPTQPEKSDKHTSILEKIIGEQKMRGLGDPELKRKREEEIANGMEESKF